MTPGPVLRGSFRLRGPALAARVGGLRGVARAGALSCGLVAFWFLACALGAPVHRLGDASTYYMMTSSLLEDGDLVYAAEDLARLDAAPFRDAPAALGLLGAGPASPYAGERYVYFDPRSVPYRPGWTPEADTGLLVPAASQTYSPKGFAYSTVKLAGILAGRVSGLLPHFFPLVLLFAAMRRFDGRKAVILAALGIFLAISVFFRSDYFGGPALGNRYFHLYPAMVLLVDRVRWRAPQLLLAGTAIAIGLPFLVNPLAHSLFPMTHTVRAPYVWFLAEPTAVEDFYYVVSDFPRDATAGVVVRGFSDPGGQPSETDVRFTTYEPREMPWGPGVASYGLSRRMTVAQDLRTGKRAVRLESGRSDFFVRIANVTAAAGAPIPVTFVFESAVEGRTTQVTVEGGGDRVAGTIGPEGGTAEARLQVRRALRYEAAHRAPRSVFTPARDRVALATVRIRTNAPVLLKGVRAPARDEP